MTEKLRQRQPNKPPSNNKQPPSKETKKTENVPKDIKLSSNNEKEQEKGSFFGRICAYMFEKDDSSILAAFRILWGFIMSYEVLEHIVNDFSKTKASFYASNIQFKYFPFDWIPLLPFEQFSIFLWVLLLISIFVMIGFFYRTSSFLFLIGFSYLFLAEAGNYLNHFYLIILMAILMIFLPCNCVFSVDSFLFPNLHSPTVPRWSIFVVRAELWIVYTYAGVAKLNEDWLRGEPLRHWLMKRVNHPYIGWLLQYDPIVYTFCYTGLIYDMVVGTMLMVNNKTIFWAGVFSTLFFHLSNKYIFNIGIFPYLCIASTSLFFNSDWPKFILFSFYSLINKKAPKYKRYREKLFSEVKARKLTTKEIIILIILFSFLIHQIYLPIRHHFYDGQVVWTEHGHRYAWRMKLRDKQCDMSIFAFHTTNKEWYEIPLAKMVNSRHYEKMTSRPEYIIQFVHYIHRKFISDAELYVYNECSLNFRSPAVMINGTVDLTKQNVWDWPYKWILDVPPLTDDEKSFLPWNFPLTFNWLFNKWESNIPKLRAMQEKIEQEKQEIFQKFPQQFEEFICSTKFTTKAECLTKKREFEGIGESKRKLSHDANRGLRLNFDDKKKNEKTLN